MPQIIVGLLFIGIVISAGWLTVFYNKMVNKKKEVDDSWVEISGLLLMKADITSVLVRQISEYLDSDQELLTKVMEAKARFVNVQTFDELVKHSYKLNKYLVKIVAISEQQPKLKIRADLLQLKYQLGEIEQNLAIGIKHYNQEAQQYREFLDAFPNNLAVVIMGIKKPDYIQVEDMSRIA